MRKLRASRPTSRHPRPISPKTRPFFTSRTSLVSSSIITSYASPVPAYSSRSLILVFDFCQLVIDDFARNGFKVYAPDLFDGSAVDQDAFEPVRRRTHRFSHSAPLPHLFHGQHIRLTNFQLNCRDPTLISANGSLSRHTDPGTPENACARSSKSSSLRA